ncbi:MAG: LysE family transporter, partial [Pseudomonadota bacterium]
PAATTADAPVFVSASTMAQQTFFVTVLNPKAIVFFIAFVPQFVDPTSPYLPQALVMVATFVGLAAVNIALYAAAATRARRAMTRPSVQRSMNRIGGSLLIGAGAATALTGRAQS